MNECASDFSDSNDDDDDSFASDDSGIDDE